MPVFTESDKCKDALSAALHKRHNYLWLQDDFASDPLYQLPWREVWCESLNPGMADELQKGQQSDGLWVVPRQVLSILNEPEKSVTRVFPYDRLMPLYYLNGQSLDEQNKRYRQQSELSRRLNRLQMLKPLSRISRGIFVIAGGTDKKQWKNVIEELFEGGMLADVPTIKIFLLGPVTSLNIDLDILAKRKQDIFIWEDSLDILLTYLREQGSLEYTGHEIMIGDQRIAVTEYLVGAVSRIDEDYYLIETQDLEEVYEINDDLFTSFMADTQPCWKGFAAGLDMNRNYFPLAHPEVRNRNPLLSKLGNDKPAKKFSVTELVERCLAISVMESGGNWTVTVPAQSGSGITTLLWSTAHQVAKMGHPVMILKSEVRKIDYNAVTNFLTSINREAQKHRIESGQDSGKEVPVLLVFDSEHQNVELIKQLAALLHNDGRSCVVLRAVDQSNEHDRETYLDLKAKGQEIVCQPLLSNVSNEEIMTLRAHLSDIKERYRLGFILPDETAWKEYQEKSSLHIWNIPDERMAERNMKAESIFWVGLRFFLGQQRWSGDRLETQLMQSMEELYSKDLQMASYLYSIAVTTHFRLVLPVSVLANAYMIEDWVKFSDDLNSAHTLIPYMVREDPEGYPEFLRFRHTAFANVIIKQLYNLVRDPQRIQPEFFPLPSNFRYPVEWLHHLIANLRAGSELERQFGNLVATQVLKLEGTQREKVAYTEQMLEGFRHFSEDFIQQNPTVLQANAITLSKSARWLSNHQEHPMEDVRERFRQATKLMKNALDLVDSNGYMDEDPRVLKTTLANIYENWARSELERHEDTSLFDRLAEQAAVLYQEVFSDWPDNTFASFGYSQLLYHRFQASEEKQDMHLPFEYLQDALACLDTAKPEIGFKQLWEKQRASIIRKISEEKYINKIQELMSNGYEFAYVLYVRFILGDESMLDDATRDAAIEVLEQADSCRKPSSSPIPRLLLLYRLITQHSIRHWDFHYRHDILSRLEAQEYRFGAQMLYDYATLCYQVDNQDDGERLFSKLRRIPPFRQLYIEQFEFWRVQGSDHASPAVRQTTMTVETMEGLRGMVRVRGIKQSVTFYAAHAWGNEMKPGMTTSCIIRFGKAGPLAIPPHYYREGGE